MPWKISGFEEKRWYKSPWPWFGVAAVIALLLLAAPHAQRVYQHWRENRRIERAETAFAKGDYKRTMLNLQMVLARNPRSLDAIRLACRTLETTKSPEALQFRRRLNTLAPEDTDNTLALAQGLIKSGDSSAAGQVLESLPADKRAGAKYHELTARVATLAKNPAAAETHWQEALRLEPANDTYRFELARVRVASRSANVRTEAMETLADLTTRPAQRLPALRVLLQNAAAFREKSRTRQFADQLVAQPEATFADHLARLSVLHSLSPNDFAPALTEVQRRAASNPGEAAQLLNWMNTNSLALTIPDWEPSLTQEVLASPPVRTALAEADARGSAWEKLKARVQGDTWEGLEFLRLAYLSRALDKLGDETAAAAAWNNAAAAAQAQPRWLESLARMVLGWGWNRKAEDLLWKLSATRNCPRWAIDQLWESSIKARDAAKAYEASRLILKAEPKNPVARNNYLSLALLTNQTGDSPHPLVEELYRQNPQEPMIATTYGYSLYLQNRPWEAVAVMNTFTRDQLDVPVVAAYTGVFLAAAGQRTEAAPFLQLAQRASLFPEERTLVDRAQDPTAAVVQVGSIDRTRTDTIQLYKESRQKYFDEPQNLNARSNYIILALLTRQNTESANQLARALYKEHPQEAAAVLGYGLSLYQQDRAPEAVATLEALTGDQLQAPLIAAYYGIFLSTAGQTDKGRKYLDLATDATLLPEEKALLAKAAK